MLSRRVVALVRGDVVLWTPYLIEWLVFWSSGTRGAQSGHSVSSGLSTGSVDPRQFHCVVFRFFSCKWRNVTKREKREAARE